MAVCRGRARRLQVPLIVTAKKNDIDLQAWLADTLSPPTKHLLYDDIARKSKTALADFLPWTWIIRSAQAKAA